MTATPGPLPENEIIAEIHRHREEFARECGYDVKEMLRRYRAAEQRATAEGHPLVSFVHEKDSAETSAIREDPPQAEG
jgi:hypothetical protein